MTLSRERQKQLGLLLAKVRKDANLTQKDIASRLEIPSGQYVSNVERGVCTVSLPYLRLIRGLVRPGFVRDYDLRVAEFYKWDMVAQFEGQVKKGDLPHKFKKLLEPCAYWEDGQKRSFMPFVEMALGLHKKLQEAEAELKRLKQPPLPSIFPEGSVVSRSFMTPPAPPEPILTGDERIHRAIKNGEQDTDSFKLMLKFKNLTLDQAMEIFRKIEHGT